MATVRSSRVSRARYTSPIPPAPRAVTESRMGQDGRRTRISSNGPTRGSIRAISLSSGRFDSTRRARTPPPRPARAHAPLSSTTQTSAARELSVPCQSLVRSLDDKGEDRSPHGLAQRFRCAEQVRGALVVSRGRNDLCECLHAAREKPLFAHRSEPVQTLLEKCASGAVILLAIRDDGQISKRQGNSPGVATPGHGRRSLRARRGRHRSVRARAARLRSLRARW